MPIRLTPSAIHTRTNGKMIASNSNASVLFASGQSIMFRLSLMFTLLVAVHSGSWAEEADPPKPSPKPTIALAAEIKSHATLSGWSPIFRGVERLDASAATPRPIQIRAIRIDLREPSIDFLVTPANGTEPKDVGARTASEFLAEFGCQVAINGSVFDVFADKRGDPMDVMGLSLSRGDLYSPPNQWDALLISQNHRAWIARSPVDSRKAYHGLGGYHALLVDGKNRGKMADLHPRSAVGITRNGRHLILMTADGRQPGYSEGLTTAETAEWMKILGAYTALNLDGGGSTTLAIEGSNKNPELLNRPSGPPAGNERRVANHLCVFAQRLTTKP